MEKKTYRGSWSANNGSSFNFGYTDTNKKRLATAMRKIARGNVFIGNTAHWTITLDDKEILSGMVRG